MRRELRMSAATAAVQATESKTVLLETNQSFQMDKLEVSYIFSYHIIVEKCYTEPVYLQTSFLSEQTTTSTYSVVSITENRGRLHVMIST